VKSATTESSTKTTTAESATKTATAEATKTAAAEAAAKTAAMEAAAAEAATGICHGRRKGTERGHRGEGNHRFTKHDNLLHNVRGHNVAGGALLRPGGRNKN
jgi:membrane protein involved in colicin uptake